MTLGLGRILLITGAVALSGCTLNVGDPKIDAGGNGGGNGGGGDDGSGDGGDGGDGGGGDDGSGDGGDNSRQISGVFVVDLHDSSNGDYVCDVAWNMTGTETSCSGCDLAFAVDLTNESGSCGLGDSGGGTLEWANASAYFNGYYIGQGYLGGGVAAFATNGYIYGSYYDYYYYGGGYY